MGLERILRAQKRFARGEPDQNGSRLRRPETQDVDRWSAFLHFLASMNFRYFEAFVYNVLNLPLRITFGSFILTDWLRM